MITPIQIRLATTADDALLYDLFAENKRDEFAPLGLPPAQFERLVSMQFRARAAGYAATHTNSVQWIVETAGGEAVGHLLLDNKPDGSIHIVDIAVARQHRGEGFATAALTLVQRAGKPVTLKVLTASPALRLYQRLGFLQLSADDLACEMEWTPSPSHHPAHPFASTAIMRGLTKFALESAGDSAYPSSLAAPLPQALPFQDFAVNRMESIF